MFNTTNNYKSETKFVPYEKKVTINEHRAVTDESVKLLNEFQEKAKDNILNTFIIDVNEMKGVAIFFQSNMTVYDSIEYGLRFVLNGKSYTTKGTCKLSDKPYLRGAPTMEGKFWVLHDFLMPEFAKVIASELMKQVPNNLLPLIDGRI